MNDDIKKLKQELDWLREENRKLILELSGGQPPHPGSLEKEAIDDKDCTTVSIPDTFRPVFLKAQEYVRHYFNNKSENPEKGTIDIHDERYILVRAASMSKGFFETIYAHYQDQGRENARKVAAGFLYDLAHSLGKADARSFHSKMKVTDPIEKLSAGPIHFAHTGWAFVKILEDSNPTPDEQYYLLYEHPFSFEADVWMKEGKVTDFPVCIMNCGYSSGWCEESFGIPLVAVELECRARGDEHCRFIMAPPSKIESYVKKYKVHPYNPSFAENHIDIPEFFQRKRLEDELRKSEETARALLNAPPESALLLDRDGKIIALNNTAVQRLGKTESELIGSNVFDLFEGELKRKRREYHQQALDSRMPVQYIDHRKDFWLDNRIYPVLDTGGQVMRVAVYSQDITELKKNELELEKHRSHLEELVSEQTNELRSANQLLTREITERNRIEKDLQNEKERLAVTLTSIAEGLVVSDINGKIVMFNRAAEELSGWTQGEARNRLVDDVFQIQDTQSLPSVKTGLFSFTRETREPVMIDEGTFQDRKGKKKLINFSASSIRDKKKETIGYIFVLRDITRIKKVEEELLKHRKIESVGLLAGGIAHDFNNLLAGILGNISIVKHTLDECSPGYKCLEACEKASISAKDLTSQLLTFSKGGVPVKKITRLDTYLKESVGFILSGSNILPRFRFTEDVWPVEIDEGLFTQAVNNLVMNAIQSMSGGGVLEVRLENHVGPDSVFSSQSRRFVKMVLKDEGSGISSEDLPRIFDPYFTTKTGGSGLGLATTYSIVKKHDGDIQVDSIIGEGTTVTLFLPAASTERNQSRENGEVQHMEDSLGKILFMDDEELVRDVGQEMLQLIGYSVETAENGEQAIEKYKKALKSQEPFKAVIMDLTVPGGMGGREAVQVIKAVDPGLRAIVSSGYSNDPIMADHKKYGFSGVVAKPYRIEEMKKVLDEVLGNGK